MAAPLHSLPTDPTATLKLAIEASGLGIWEMDVLTGHINWSDRCNELFFLPPGTQITYRDFLDCLHPEDWRRVDQIVRHAFDPTSTGFYDTEYRVIDRTSPAETVRWIRSAGQAFTNSEGRTHYFVGTVRDVTKLKSGIAEFRLLADTLPEFVWAADAAGNLDFYNRRYFEYTGLPDQEHTAIDWMALVHPHDQAPTTAAWARCVATGEPYEHEFRLRGHDGQYRWLRARAQPLRSPQGIITRWYGTGTDIQAEKDKQYLLEQRVAALEQQLAGDA